MGKRHAESRPSEAEGDLEATRLPGVENMGCAGDADPGVDHGVGDAARDGGEGGPAGVGPGEVWRRRGGGGREEDRAAGSRLRGRRRAVVPESARARRDDGSAARVFVPDVCECRGGHHIHHLPTYLSIYLSHTLQLQALQHPLATRNQRIVTNILRFLSLAAFPLTLYQPAASPPPSTLPSLHSADVRV